MSIYVGIEAVSNMKPLYIPLAQFTLEPLQPRPDDEHLQYSSVPESLLEDRPIPLPFRVSNDDIIWGKTKPPKGQSSCQKQTRCRLYVSSTVDEDSSDSVRAAAVSKRPRRNAAPGIRGEAIDWDAEEDAILSPGSLAAWATRSDFLQSQRSSSLPGMESGLSVVPSGPIEPLGALELLKVQNISLQNRIRKLDAKTVDLERLAEKHKVKAKYEEDLRKKWWVTIHDERIVSADLNVALEEEKARAQGFQGQVKRRDVAIDLLQTKMEDVEEKFDAFKHAARAARQGVRTTDNRDAFLDGLQADERRSLIEWLNRRARAAGRPSDDSALEVV